VEFIYQSNVRDEEGTSIQYNSRKFHLIATSVLHVTITTELGYVVQEIREI
jgi:hypothetical protein